MKSRSPLSAVVARHNPLSFVSKSKDVSLPDGDHRVTLMGVVHKGDSYYLNVATPNGAVVKPAPVANLDPDSDFLGQHQDRLQSFLDAVAGYPVRDPEDAEQIIDDCIEGKYRGATLVLRVKNHASGAIIYTFLEAP